MLNFNVKSELIAILKEEQRIYYVDTSYLSSGIRSDYTSQECFLLLQEISEIHNKLQLILKDQYPYLSFSLRK